MLLKLLDHCFEIGVSRAKLSREPVPASLSNSFAVRDHFELTGLTRRKDAIDS